MVGFDSLWLHQTCWIRIVAFRPFRNRDTVVQFHYPAPESVRGNLLWYASILVGFKSPAARHGWFFTLEGKRLV